MSNNKKVKILRFSDGFEKKIIKASAGFFEWIAPITPFCIEKRFKVTINIRPVGKPELSEEFTITKDSLQELEDTLIAIVSPEVEGFSEVTLSDKHLTVVKPDVMKIDTLPYKPFGLRGK